MHPNGYMNNLKVQKMSSTHPSQPPRDLRHELDYLLEQAGDVVFRLDQLGKILFASQRASGQTVDLALDARVQVD